METAEQRLAREKIEYENRNQIGKRPAWMPAAPAAIVEEPEPEPFPDSESFDPGPEDYPSECGCGCAERETALYARIAELSARLDELAARLDSSPTEGQPQPEDSPATPNSGIDWADLVAEVSDLKPEPEPEPAPKPSRKRTKSARNEQIREWVNKRYGSAGGEGAGKATRWMSTASLWQDYQDDHPLEAAALSERGFASRLTYAGVERGNRRRTPEGFVRGWWV